MNFRKGDKVSLIGIVKHNQSDDKERIFVDIVDSHETVWLKPYELKMVEPLFEVGDQCAWDKDGENSREGTILAINHGHAWIDLGGGDYCTRLLTAIERVETPEDEQ